MEYIISSKNLAAETMSRFLLDEKLNSTHKYNYTTEKSSEMHGVEKLPEGTFNVIFKTSNHSQRKYPGIKSGLLSVNYTKVNYYVVQKTMTLVTHKCIIVI